LPEAHVEAPTVGSVILAGLLLKLGTYGILRFLLPLFPYATKFFTPLIYTLASIAVIYASATTLRQTDLKKIIAYSSVAHMNFALIGLFSNTYQGLQGSILMMLSHGLVSSGLFLCVGMLYDRYKTRIIKYYGGLTQLMPVYAILFLIFTLANIGFPGTSSFLAEFLIMVSAVKISLFITFLASLSLMLSAAYAI